MIKILNMVIMSKEEFKRYTLKRKVGRPKKKRTYNKVVRK